MGQNLANMVDSPISMSIFWPKTPGQQARHEQGHCHDAGSKHQAKVQVFSDEEPHVTLPIFPNNNAVSLFNFVQETQNEQCPCDKKQKQMNIVFTSAHDMGAFFGLGDADFFHCMLWRFVSGSY
jgi:hypothetical protein